MVCDKCGKYVEINNSARTFQHILEYGRPSDKNDFTYFTGFSDRHLVPTDSCEGSPSRYRRLKDHTEKSDDEDFDSNTVEKYRKAYELLKALS